MDDITGALLPRKSAFRPVVSADEDSCVAQSLKVCAAGMKSLKLYGGKRYRWISAV